MDDDKLIASLQHIKALAEECLADLGQSVKPTRAGKKPAVLSHATEPRDLDFSKPVNPFVKEYGKTLSGPGKFVLLLAWYAKGDLKKEIALIEIQRQWNRMTSQSLMGMEFNRFYTAQARNSDWVELKKKGIYSLRPSWKNIFKD